MTASDETLDETLDETPDQKPPDQTPSVLDVLVVDDDPAVARLVRVVLEREGLQVEHVLDAAQATEFLGGRSCHVVLTDYTMPGVNGLEMLQNLESDGVQAAFLVMSAFLEPEVMAALCAEPAVAGVITKPFELSDLVLDVRAVLEARKPAAVELLREAPGESPE
jgi:DNA-binding NtrC family response regulator